MPIIKNVNQLNERIIFQKTVRSGPEAWEELVDVFSCWAQIRTQNIKDVRQGVINSHEDLTEFVIRYHQPEEIDNVMTIKWNGGNYNIVKLNRDNADKEFNVILGKKQH